MHRRDMGFSLLVMMFSLWLMSSCRDCLLELCMEWSAVKIAQNGPETALNGIGTESWNVVLQHQTLTHLVLSYDGCEVWGCEGVGE